MGTINPLPEEIIAMERRGRLVDQVMQACPTRAEKMAFLEALLAVVHHKAETEKREFNAPVETIVQGQNDHIDTSEAEDMIDGIDESTEAKWDVPEAEMYDGEDEESPSIIPGLTKLMRRVWYVDVDRMRPDAALAHIVKFREELKNNTVDLGRGWLREDIIVPGNRSDCQTEIVQL